MLAFLFSFDFKKNILQSQYILNLFYFYLLSWSAMTKKHLIIENDKNCSKNINFLFTISSKYERIEERSILLCRERKCHIYVFSFNFTRKSMKSIRLHSKSLIKWRMRTKSAKICSFIKKKGRNFHCTISICINFINCYIISHKPGRTIKTNNSELQLSLQIISVHIKSY